MAVHVKHMAVHVKHNRLGGGGETSNGFTKWLSQQSSLLDGKSKSPLFPGAWGLGLQMTGALHAVLPVVHLIVH